MGFFGRISCELPRFSVERCRGEERGWVPTHERADAGNTPRPLVHVETGLNLVLPIVRIGEGKSRHPFSDWLYVRGVGCRAGLTVRSAGRATRRTAGMWRDQSEGSMIGSSVGGKVSAGSMGGGSLVAVGGGWVGS